MVIQAMRPGMLRRLFATEVLPMPYHFISHCKDANWMIKSAADEDQMGVSKYECLTVGYIHWKTKRMISQFPREGGIQSSRRTEMRSTPACAGSLVMPNMDYRRWVKEEQDL